MGALSRARLVSGEGASEEGCCFGVLVSARKIPFLEN